MCVLRQIKTITIYREEDGRENKNRKIFKVTPDKQRFVKRSVLMSCFELISLIIQVMGQAFAIKKKFYTTRVYYPRHGCVFGVLCVVFELLMTFARGYI